MNLRKIKLTDVGTCIRGQIDLFICSGSFESRCHSIAKSLRQRSVRSALVLEAIDLKKYTGAAAQELMLQFSGKSEIVPVNTKDPLFSADKISEALFRNFAKYKPKQILVDITTVTHEVLLILLKLLRIQARSANSLINILYAYTSASDYSIGDTVKFKWLSKGVQGVRTVLGFPGDSLPTRKTHLIILVGYEFERALKLIEIVEPNSISLGFGRSGTQTAEKNKNANKHFHILLERVAASYAVVDSFEISSDDPITTRNAIQMIVSARPGSNILLAPMNNKMTTLGAALAALACNQIQVCYAPVLEYNFQNYSSPGENCYLVDLPEIMGQ